MTTPHGSSAYVSCDGTDISQFVEGWSLPQSQGTAEVTGMGDSDQEFIAALKSGTFGMNGHWDKTTQHGNLQGTFDGAVVEMIVGPGGNASGEVSLTANYLVTDYTITASTTDKVALSASFQRTGALTDATFA